MPEFRTSVSKPQRSPQGKKSNKIILNCMKKFPLSQYLVLFVEYLKIFAFKSVKEKKIFMLFVLLKMLLKSETIYSSFSVDYAWK